MIKIVALDGYTLNPGDNPWAPVEQHGELKVYDRTSPEEILERAIEAEIILTNKVAIDKALLEQLPNLKFIGVTATGYNVVDVSSAHERGIPVSNVPVYSTASVAQHVFAALLSFIHQPTEHHNAIQDGEWQRRNNFSFWLSPLTELAGKTIGIVGLGRIGRATAALASAFGMKVVAHSRRQINPLSTEGFEWLELDELFTKADVISLHCPQTESNEGFVNRELIEKCPATQS